MSYLYKNFLENKKVYNLNEAFYVKMLESITNNKPTHFFNRHYRNGKKIYDEHIFSTKYNGRILQIIQQDPASAYPEIAVSMKKWDDKEDLLIVNMKLSSETKEKLRTIIENWLQKRMPILKMNDSLEKILQKK